MFRWVNRTKKASVESSKKLKEAVDIRNEAIARAVHKMNLIFIDKRFKAGGTIEDRRKIA